MGGMEAAHGSENPLGHELAALWGKFTEFRERSVEFELMCSNGIAEYWDGREEAVDVDKLARAIEIMMVAGFAIELAESRSTAVSLKISERHKEIVIIDDHVPGTEMNGFWMGVDVLEDGSLELWFDVGVLMAEYDDIVESSLDKFPRVSELITNSEFVFFAQHACEEYAHMAFDVFKPEEILIQDMEVGSSLDEERSMETDPDRKVALVMVQNSEYRGGVWKAWFMRTNLPSFRSSWPRLIAMAGQIRRERRIYP